MVKLYQFVNGRLIFWNCHILELNTRFSIIPSFSINNPGTLIVSLLCILGASGGWATIRENMMSPVAQLILLYMYEYMTSNRSPGSNKIVKLNTA